MKTIAFSWIGNTWKSTAINDLKNKLESDWQKVLVYPETARQLFDILETQGILAFQKAINKKEIERLHEIHEEKTKGIYDTLLIDRTTVDNRVYFEFNKNIWKIAENEYIEKTFSYIYDKIILFTEPIKQTNTREDFKAYDDYKYLRVLFDRFIKHYYDWRKIVELQNNKEDWDKIYKLIK